MTDRERLIELITESGACFNCFPVGNFDEYQKQKITDYLLKNGVIVPLCKVGDVVYQTDGVRIYELEIFDVLLYKNKLVYETESIDFDTRAIDKTVFLTREEAEKALKERETE